jgi:outer membrane murein-binding lipoprotein Lpp
MKKGLLSLLAVALTVVGCQNYDDQFDELSDQITALSATVQGLSTVADQLLRYKTQ